MDIIEGHTCSLNSSPFDKFYKCLYLYIFLTSAHCKLETPFWEVYIFHGTLSCWCVILTKPEQLTMR